MGNVGSGPPSGVDLVTEAKKHYEFIQQLNFTPSIYHPNNIKRSIIRYEQFWLPFARSFQNEFLIAPLDIELIWVVHMLNPVAYERDCFAIANRLIRHEIVTKEERDSDERAEQLWNNMYRNGEPFYVDINRIPSDTKPYRSELSSHLINAVKEYREFCRQVSLPHYKDDKFLELALQTYIEGALSGDLRKTAYPYHNSFMWKTHQLFPSDYRRDSKFLKETHNMNTLAMRGSVKSVKSVKSMRSKSLTFRRKRRGSLPLPPMYSNQSQIVYGAMYRGEQTDLQARVGFQKMVDMGSNVYNMSVIAVKLQELDPDRQYRLIINGKTPTSRQDVNLLSFEIKSKGNILLKTFNNTQEDQDFRFQFDEEKYGILQIALIENETDRSSAIHPKTRNCYSTQFSFPNGQAYKEGEQFKITFRLPMDSETHRALKPEINGWISFATLKPSLGIIKYTFGKDKHHLASTNHYCDVIKNPLVMVPYATKVHDCPADYMNLIMKDTHGKPAFRCRILQSRHGDFSSVEVMDFEDRMVASSYTVGKETLPTADQVGAPEHCCILRDLNEMVFVIRGTNYEWGLLKVFQDMKSHEVTPAGVLFMNISDRNPTWQRLYDHHNKVHVLYHKARKGGLLVNLENCSITLPPLYHEFPDLLALGVTLLTLFCVKEFQRL
ncbi:uncharacterized protein [Clytia hemisphaerica]|uniref:Uncharacterized protein n=1 Tax=Clytia hemisphaerica TaxID=252671 RepID=A0A7M6DKT2_9CNID